MVLILIERAIYYNEDLGSQAKFMDEEETKPKRSGYLGTCIKRLTMPLKDTRNSEWHKTQEPKRYS